jgi:hypothetical protein
MGGFMAGDYDRHADDVVELEAERLARRDRLAEMGPPASWPLEQHPGRPGASFRERLEGERVFRAIENEELRRRVDAGAIIVPGPRTAARRASSWWARHRDDVLDLVVIFAVFAALILAAAIAGEAAPPPPADVR